MHLPLLSRVLFLVFQFMILTMALPAASRSGPVASEDLTQREADAAAVPEAESKDTPVRRTVFGKRLEIQKPGSPVKAMVRSPDGPRGEQK